MMLHIRRRAVPALGADWPASLHPVLRRVYAARGAIHPLDVEHRLAHLAPPHALGGLDRAIDLLQDAIGRQRRIVVAGDYDCDGATGVAVAVRGLRMLGAQRVGYVVPNRFTHGYGLSPALVESLAGPPDLIVTVDNGIASHAGVTAARARGIGVIVTDHHLPGASLPAADAIVNPNLPGDAFPSKALAGVGVMFYVLLALRARLRGVGIFGAHPEPDLSVLLDLVALGTVADMVPLDRNNRVLVEAGLRRIRDGRGCAGIVALAEASQRSVGSLVASDIGFALAPRLNAAGRLEDMRLGIECLLSDDPGRARELASRLSDINRERRELQAGMLADADAMVPATGVPDATGVVLFDPGWHAGVVGLVASRLKERLHRPVVAVAPADEGSDELRGSARSIPGLHVRDALADVDAAHPGLIRRFGGHAMAAGLALERHRLDDFSQAFDAAVAARIEPDALQPVLWTDGELAPGEFTLELARALRYAGPWGQAFAEPLFDNELVCMQQRPMGTGHRRLRLCDPRGGESIEGVMFNVPSDLPMQVPVRMAYALTVNDWQGRETPRLLLRHIEAPVADAFPPGG